MWTRAQAMENYNYWNDERVINSMVTDDNFFIQNSKTEINMNWVREKWDDWSHYQELVEGEEDWTLEQWNEATEQAWKKWLKDLGGSATVQCETKFVICPTCNGRGTHTNPNIDCGGITASEWAEWGPEEQDRYMSGGYDVTCSHCNGEKVIQEFEYDTKNPLYNWCCERLQEYYQDQYDYAREVAAERAWGA